MLQLVSALTDTCYNGYCKKYLREWLEKNNGLKLSKVNLVVGSNETKGNIYEILMACFNMTQAAERKTKANSGHIACIVVSSGRTSGIRKLT